MRAIRQEQSAKNDQLRCSGIQRNQSSVQHQSCNAPGQQVTAGALKHSRIRNLDHPLTPPALALGCTGAGKQAQSLTFLFGIVEEAQFGELLEGARIQLDHLVDQHVGTVRKQVDTERLGLIQWAITEISHAKQGNKLRERFNAAVVIVFGELLIRVFAEVIGVIKSQAAVVFLKGVNLWFFRLSDGWRGRSGQPFLPCLLYTSDAADDC